MSLQLFTKETELALYELISANSLNDEMTLHTFPWNGWWVPSELEISISRARIQERIAQKPSWYRWTSTLV
jgi:hypothetical protein